MTGNFFSLDIDSTSFFTLGNTLLASRALFCLFLPVQLALTHTHKPFRLSITSSSLILGKLCKVNNKTFSASDWNPEDNLKIELLTNLVVQKMRQRVLHFKIKTREMVVGAKAGAQPTIISRISEIKNFFEWKFMTFSSGNIAAKFIADSEISECVFPRL